MTLCLQNRAKWSLRLCNLAYHYRVSALRKSTPLQVARFRCCKRLQPSFVGHLASPGVSALLSLSFYDEDHISFVSHHDGAQQCTSSDQQQLCCNAPRLGDFYTMLERSGIHWLAPTLMILSLAVGVLFAGAHHAFNSSLNQTRVDFQQRKIIGFRTSQQQINTDLGTAFAFLVKAFLATSAGIAFLQTFWRNLTRTTSDSSLAKVDTIYSLHTNILSLVQVRS